MSSPLGTFTVTLRKIATGYKIVSFVIDDLTQAHSIARVLVASRLYEHCFAVATDCTGAIVMNVQPGGPQPEALPAVQQVRAIDTKPQVRSVPPIQNVPRVVMSANRPAPALPGKSVNSGSSVGGVDRLIAAVKMIGR